MEKGISSHPSPLDPSSPPFSQVEKGDSNFPLSTWERGEARPFLSPLGREGRSEGMEGWG